MDYGSLQNGSDIRGVALSGIPGQEINLTQDVVQNIAIGFGLWLSKHCKTDTNLLRVGIGRDSRLSGPDMVLWTSQALQSLGITVFDCGLASTPAMFMSTITPGFEYDGAIMITASHLPFNRNGLKFFVKEGGLEKQNISDILSFAEQQQGKPLLAQSTACQKVDFISVYASQLVDFVRREVNALDYDHPLDGFHIIVDAGNGAGGFYADRVLQPLGADTTGSQFLDPDGSFPNHMPNPEDEQAMQSICEAVRAQNADFGIIFDTDVDRAGAVDEKGNEINRNRLIAMISAILLETHPSTTIVTDSITSSGLKSFIESHGGIHRRFKRGYKNVINEAIRLNAAGQDSQLAIETSGHGALKENYFLDDGAYLVTKLLVKLAQLKAQNKPISSLIATLAEPAESFEFRLNITDTAFAKTGKKILVDLEDYAKAQNWQVAPDNFEGLRISFPADQGNGWFLLRMSLHDPLMPLNIESDQIGGSKQIARTLAAFLHTCSGLDCRKINDFLA